ncbi:hypothetical protein F4604DRAFT_1680571 [Suillus subluteus]|nr:hypothetical protein F4604DRAFT_1680571 [Suillus subluteus]
MAVTTTPTRKPSTGSSKLLANSRSHALQLHGDNAFWIAICNPASSNAKQSPYYKDIYGCDGTFEVYDFDFKTPAASTGSNTTGAASPTGGGGVVALGISTFAGVTGTLFAMIFL